MHSHGPLTGRRQKGDGRSGGTDERDGRQIVTAMTTSPRSRRQPPVLYGAELPLYTACPRIVPANCVSGANWVGELCLGPRTFPRGRFWLPYVGQAFDLTLGFDSWDAPPLRIWVDGLALKSVIRE